MRKRDLGLLPASNHATSSSRVSIGVMSTWSRAMQGVPTERAATLHGARKGGQLGHAPCARSYKRQQHRDRDAGQGATVIRPPPRYGRKPIQQEPPRGLSAPRRSKAADRGRAPGWDDSVFRALARRWTNQGQHRWEMAWF